MSFKGYHDERSTSSSGTSTPAMSASWASTSFSSAVGGLLKRFASETSSTFPSGPKSPSGPSIFSSTPSLIKGMDGVYTPPNRIATPFQPPPLYPILLKGYQPNTPASAQLLTRTLAEEIRLLVPPRLQLCDEWNLVYSLEEDGVSLGTLYKKCDTFRGLRNGFVLVVRDGEGGLFGAYMTEAPHPNPHYFGTGECFLWRASILSSINLANLPPPPSSDTTNMQRSTTISSGVSADTNGALALPTPTSAVATGASTPERIRFKAFPYSGVNDYMMLCEAGYLSLGGGDGRYGLWLDDAFEKGISSTCSTFGNEPLSDEGEKFDVLGVELWSIGNTA